ncbi:glycoside hydrolase family 68 protein [Novosphingobium cyanobacteriorum]|uniref:Glycoside hydrolase family 68 protein n=1 Tax=Novosphingobium cyanobacteriorum TaxID=3024215 RepID=A0ABT6CDJ7_9SPHN|nr:glycoside hydrolase family 68 protein [Novosphingobium cyanobacteriorum]MDF8332002.1 glycoside hydrolase family 68 protein [Novosphingobium cyanobacteriorum]
MSDTMSLATTASECLADAEEVGQVLIHGKCWAASDLAYLDPSQVSHFPVLCAEEVGRVLPDLDVWDAWPLADCAGRPIEWRGGELWFALAAPAFADPEERHGHARIHHFHRLGSKFRHLGVTMPEGLSPGSREWSGAARLEGSEVALYFTAAGMRGELRHTYRQRLFVTRSRLPTAGSVSFPEWSHPCELLAAGGPYQPADQSEGAIGEIKAFRDPFPWRDDEGRDYLLFTASSAAAPRAFNGLVGLAAWCSETGKFRHLPPLIDATDVNNELERPHIVFHNGRLYLFWSTQGKVFAPGLCAPTGLYGATAASIEGPWELLNGHGLVAANPENEPYQAYSWWVLPDLTVAAFVDYWGVDDPMAAAKPNGRDHFGGTFAPFFSLWLEGTNAGLATTRQR